jgi:hypothetical protein
MLQGGKREIDPGEGSETKDLYRVPFMFSSAMDNRLLTGQLGFPSVCYRRNIGNASFGLSESKTIMSTLDTQTAQEHNRDCKVFIAERTGIYME